MNGVETNAGATSANDEDGDTDAALDERARRTLASCRPPEESLRPEREHEREQREREDDRVLRAASFPVGR